MAAREQGVHILEAYRHWLGCLNCNCSIDRRAPSALPQGQPEDLDLASSINLVVLSRKTIASRCRVLGSNRQLPRSSGPIWPFQVRSSLFDRKTMELFRSSVLSGDIESVKFDAMPWSRSFESQEFGNGIPPITTGVRKMTRLKNGPNRSFLMDRDSPMKWNSLPGQNPQVTTATRSSRP